VRNSDDGDAGRGGFGVGEEALPESSVGELRAADGGGGGGAGRVEEMEDGGFEETV